MNIETQDADKCIIKSIEKQFNEIDSKTAWPVFYQHIRNESNNYEYTSDASKKPENKNLNRYRDVNPYDHSRVVLVKGASDRQRSDYINASLVRMPNAHRQYILAQGPLPNTSEHFWLMIWEQNCKAVIMLNRVIEKNQVKCHQYWPLGGEGNSEMLLPSVGLRVEYVSETNVSYYTTRVLRLTDLDSGDSREVLHFHYTTWPDFGVPQSPMAFLHFLMVVRRSGALDENVGPPVVHCSAGIGRSGTFCLVDTCLVLMEDGHCAVNVRDVLMEMRRHRMGLIQTPDQLRFSYLAILEGARKLLNREPGSVDLELFNVNQLDCEEQQEEEAPPPRPPPRGESLMARSLHGELESNHVGDGGVVIPPLVLPPEIMPELPPDRPLPCEPGGPDRPLPCKPGDSSEDSDDESDEEEEEEEDQEEEVEEAASSGEESFQSSNSTDKANSHTESEASAVRRRRRHERQERTNEMVRNIKRKQQEAESWQEFKRLNKRQKRSHE